MAIVLNSYTFDDRHTSITEKLEEVGGRNERAITIKGVIVGKDSAQAVHDELDLLLAAASTEDYTAELVIRTGRRLLVRRDGFTRDVHGESLTGAFTLELDAQHPHEESISAVIQPWSVAFSGDTLLIAPGGNTVTAPKLTFVSLEDVVDPSFSDGLNKMSYLGTVPAGSLLVLDAPNKTVTLDGVEALAYTTGTFPVLDPAGTTLVFEASALGAEYGDCAIEYRSRWH